MQALNSHTLTTLKLDSALELCRFTIEQARQQQVTISVAVVDVSDQLPAFQRTDQSILVPIEAAIGKARTATLLGKSATVSETMINQGHPALLSIPGLTPLAGSVPVAMAGQVVAAIDISGATGDIDEAIAIAVATAASEVSA